MDLDPPLVTRVQSDITPEPRQGRFHHPSMLAQLLGNDESRNFCRRAASSDAWAGGLEASVLAKWRLQLLRNRRPYGRL